MGNGCCGGSNSASVIMQAKQDLDGQLPGGNRNMNTQIGSNVKVRMEYFGPRVGAVTYHGKRRHYRFGNNPIDRYDDVNPEDVEILLRQADFRVVGKDGQTYQTPEFDFVPEPAGAVVQEVVPEPAGDPIAESDVETEYWEDEADNIEPTREGAPPALDIIPSPNTVKEIKSAVRGADLDTLLAWLRKEHDGKNRKTAIEAIESALEEI